MNIRNMLLGFLLIPVLTLAHPLDSEGIDHIGVGSVLRVKSDINIAPLNNELFYTIYDKVSENLSAGATCKLFIAPSQVDRVLKAGKELRVSKVLNVYDSYGKFVHTKILFAGPAAIKHLVCRGYTVGFGELQKMSSFNVTSIGVVKNLTAKDFEVILAEPEDI